MARNRTQLGLAVAVILLGGVQGLGQGLRDAQLFAPADLSRYGGGHRASEGYFFIFDGLEWSISAPDETSIGFDGLTRTVVPVPSGGFADPPPPPYPSVVQSNSLRTGFLETEWSGGQRYEFGYVSGHQGWLFSGFSLSDQNQRGLATNVDVVFQDAPIGPPIGPLIDPTTGAVNFFITSRLQGYADTALTVGADLPVTFADVRVYNKVQMWGVEWNYMYRMHPGHRGGFFEVMFGVRYMEFDENFDVEALGDPDDAAAAVKYILADSIWQTEAENHIIGPQLGVRWFRKQMRWTWSTEARFFAGFNSQSINQRASLATLLDKGVPLVAGVPVKMTPTQSQVEANLNEWSPAAELRVDLKYQLTRAISGRVGWTGMWIDGIARPSDMINYSLNADGSIMGILVGNNRQGIFVNGVTFGIEVNR